MRLLLDTHLWLWWLAADTRLSKEARAAVEDPGNEVFVSAISVWEATIKIAAGKLDVQGDLEKATLASQMAFLPFGHRHAAAIGKLGMFHRDPFDRALVAQALLEGMRLLTSDSTILLYAPHADIQLV